MLHLILVSSVQWEKYKGKKTVLDEEEGGMMPWIASAHDLCCTKAGWMSSAAQSMQLKTLSPVQDCKGVSHPWPSNGDGQGIKNMNGKKEVKF
jgi:hypothetical protein